jgi:hypothetical protein
LLANVPPIRHVLQCGWQMPHVVRNIWQGLEDALLEQCHQLLQQCLHPLGLLHELAQHECLVAHAPIPFGDRSWSPHVGDPHLQKAPAARQKPKRRIDKLTRQRVEDDIHTPAIRCRQKFRLEARVARTRDVPRIQSHPFQHRPLARARRAIHLDAEVPAELHRGHPHASRRRVYQYPLARLDLPELLQRIQCRQIRKRYRRCRLKRHPRWDFRHQVCRRHRSRSKAPHPKPKHSIPNRHRRHIRANRFHHTGKLKPDAR